MSSSSPADLVVTFRSIPRRLRESQGTESPSPTTSTGRQIQSKLDEAARLLSAAPTAGAIADAIAAVQNREWDGATLDSLREIALDVGGLLRAPESDEDDEDSSD